MSNDAFEKAFNAIVADEPPKGTSRIIVLDNPTSAQLRNLPIGADCIYSDDVNFMSGPWTEEMRDTMLHLIESTPGPCDHVHCYLAFLPPVPTPDSALSAEAIAADLVAGVDETEMTLTVGDVRHWIRAGIERAREGMVFPPF